MRKVTHARKRNAWADRDELLHWCRGPRRNHLCQLLWLSLMGFERGGGSNFEFLHWLALSPLQHSRTTVRVCDNVRRTNTGEETYGRPRTMLSDWLLKTEEGNISYEELKMSAQDMSRWSQWRWKPALLYGGIDKWLRGMAERCKLPQSELMQMPVWKRVLVHLEL